MKPIINTIAYTCSDNKCYITWVYDKMATAYEIYRNDILLKTVAINELDEPFIFSKFPRNKLFRSRLLISKSYIDDTVKKFNTYEYKIRAIYENGTYSDYSNIKYVLCE